MNGGFEQLAEKLSGGPVREKDIQWSYTIRTGTRTRRRSFTGWMRIATQERHRYSRAVHLLISTASWMPAKQHFDVLLFLGYTSSSGPATVYAVPKDTRHHLPTWTGWSGNPQVFETGSLFSQIHLKGWRLNTAIISLPTPLHAFVPEKQIPGTVKYIAYGAEILTHRNKRIPGCYGLCKKDYYMLMATWNRRTISEMSLRVSSRPHPKIRGERAIPAINSANGW